LAEPKFNSPPATENPAPFFGVREFPLPGTWQGFLNFPLPEFLTASGDLAVFQKAKVLPKIIFLRFRHSANAEIQLDQAVLGSRLRGSDVFSDFYEIIRSAQINAEISLS